MKRFLSAFLSFVMVISLFGYTAYADTGISCPLVNKHLMKNEDFYNGYALENLVASKSGSTDETFLMLGGVDPETGIITEIPDETVTGTNKMKQLVTRKLLFLPFGSAFTFDSTDVYDANGRKIPNLDLRVYEYDKNGKFIGSVNSVSLSPENNADSDATCKSFIVTKKEGMYVYLRFIPWEFVFDKNTVSDFEKRLNVYDLISVNAPVFDNSTITKCWANEDSYEAWATKTIFYNKIDDMYYWFYASQSSHTIYDGCIRVRTSKDLENWSESRVVYDTKTEGFCFTMDGAFQTDNGDIVICLMVGENDNDVVTKFLRSTDNGISWELENFILDGEIAENYRLQRPRVLDDGRIFTSYFDKDRKEISSIAYSTDNGKTFVSADFSSSFSLKDNGEYDFVKLRNGNILSVQRAGGISASISVDDGKTFVGEKSLKTVDKNSQMVNAPFIVYDEKTDNLVIYEIDRFKTGALVGIYTTGDKISDYLFNDSEFGGFFVNSCYLGNNGNVDEGYPHIVKTKDGGYKCFYYYPANDGKNRAGFYSVGSIDYEKYSHTPVWKNENNIQVNVCEKCGEELIRLRFTDLTGFGYYNDFVAYTSHYNSFFKGTNPPYYTEFSPKTALTRSMLVTILYRMAGSPYDDSNPFHYNPFTDVSRDAYYYNSACWALNNGITDQITFRPNDNVSRQETAAFLFRYAQENNKLGSDDYRNTDISQYHDYNSIRDWARESMQWANYNGMITGTEQGYANPQGATLRIHAAKILYGFGNMNDNENPFLPYDSYVAADPDMFGSVAVVQGKLLISDYCGTESKIYIPSKMNYNNREYPVQLRGDTFKDNTVVKNVIFAENIYLYDNFARMFNGAVNLNSAVIENNGTFANPEVVKDEVADFSNCPKLEKIYSLEQYKNAVSYQISNSNLIDSIPINVEKVTIKSDNIDSIDCAIPENVEKINIVSSSLNGDIVINSAKVSVFDMLSSLGSPYINFQKINIKCPNDSLTMKTVNRFIAGGRHTVSVESLDKSDIKINKIYALGDSLTAGPYYLSQLNDLLDDNTVAVNYAAEGDCAAHLQNRIGLNQIKIKENFIIPENKEKVRISVSSDFCNSTAKVSQDTGGVNCVTVNGVLGFITYENGNYYFSRAESGKSVAVKAGEIIKTEFQSSYRNDGTLIIYIGTNDYAGGMSNDFAKAKNLADRIKAIIDYCRCDDYIIVGLAFKKSGDAGSCSDENSAVLEKTMLDYFGNHFLNLREYFIKNAYSVCTELDIDSGEQKLLDKGIVPDEFFMDSTHWKRETGGKVVAQAIYEKLKELNYI